MSLPQPIPVRNALKAPSPQQRAFICQILHRELALEQLSRTDAKRQAWARIAIGLRPVPRREALIAARELANEVRP
jgi:hypothetical protein